ncbi:phage holin family protein [Mycobacterium sp. SM1]|uniref:phage holin family protein n=1 Tax=Mycobacterium sp. SM1 TaxID=2816243 RepID=UPI001BCDBA1A|nr:phage holin family protein [Mycobacterium sp. SM1]MBS4728996.1 phage holin family protein [Mycobacterium sp. SM1]
MKQILLRAAVFLGSWAIGLLVAAWVVPGVAVSASGFIAATLLFSVSQASLSALILKLPRAYASLMLGGTGLALTVVALGFASAFTDGLSIDGVASWVAATVVVWLVTTIGAISVPDVLVRGEAGAA